MATGSRTVNVDDYKDAWRTVSGYREKVKLETQERGSKKRPHRAEGPKPRTQPAASSQRSQSGALQMPAGTKLLGVRLCQGDLGEGGWE